MVQSKLKKHIETKLTSCILMTIRGKCKTEWLHNVTEERHQKNVCAVFQTTLVTQNFFLLKDVVCYSVTFKGCVSYAEAGQLQHCFWNDVYSNITVC